MSAASRAAGRWFTWVLLASCASLCSVAGDAEPLPFEGTLEFRIPTVQPFWFAAAGVADLSGPASSPRIALGADLFKGSVALLLTQTYVPPFAELRADVANGAGTFSRPAPDRGFGGVLPLRGVARLCLFSVCSAAPLANLTLPLSAIGRAAFVTAPGVVNMTVQGAPWTTQTPQPIVPGGQSSSSSQTQTRFPVGGVGAGADTVHVRLVAPIYIRTNIPSIANITGAGIIEFAVGAGCDDGLDNDADGVTDADDPGCSSPSDPSERSNTACDDGWDLDRDGWSDYPEDPGCESPSDLDERKFYACDDGIDNDGDGFFDHRISQGDAGCGSPLDDSEKTSRYACDDGLDDDEDGLVDLADPGCLYVTDPSERPGIECRNGLDDDGDGATDYPADTGCAYDSDQTETTACANGRDDDEDGAIDFPADPGCDSPADEEEIRRDLLFQCDNGEDDDQDAPDRLRDRWDPGCTSNLDPVEGPNDDCRDGSDNDRDGLVDFPADPGCSAPDDPLEYDVGTACDNGRDDDGDRVRDFFYSGAIFIGDPGCASPADTSEWSAIACDNGLDDDGDGSVDWVGHDRGCSSRTDNSERGADECDDGVDNDSDGATDYPADPQCSGPWDTTEEIDCNDGEDDDGDGRVDFPNDPGCASADDESERSTAACDNGRDDDFDRLIDGSDPGCDDSADASERGSLVCDDEVDQDGDGQAAFRTNGTLIEANTLSRDLGCTSLTDPDETRPDQACDDGIDNDGDGLVDFQEAHCRYSGGSGFSYGWRYTASSELDSTAACDDGLDNDGDGAIDSLDPGCPFPQARPENPLCDDGLDNDGDGLVDFEDPWCTHSWPYWETAPCGLGAELAVLLPLASWLGRRCRRAA